SQASSSHSGGVAPDDTSPVLLVIEPTDEDLITVESDAGLSLTESTSLPAGTHLLDMLDSLQALTVDLPPPSSFGNWTVDTDLAESGRIEQIEGTEEACKPVAVSLPEAGNMSYESPRSNPVVVELERWLAAIESDRATLR